MKKIGLLVESGPSGLEAIVCRRICDLLNAQHNVDFDVDVVPMDNKRRLLNECGSASQALLVGGCERVIILWDERPAWPTSNEKLCWHRDRQFAIGSLNAAGLDLSRVHLVCIEREFESWLLFDHGMLSRVLSRPTHPVSFPKQSHPDRNINPKGTVTSKFRELAGQTYVDLVFARRFAEEIDSLSRLLRCATFKRFASRLAGINF